jgi:hypothetical protein
MLGFSHHGRHERTSQSAPQQLPEKFRPLLDHAERKAQDLWVDPRHEDMMRALRRDFEQWRHRQQ